REEERFLHYVDELSGVDEIEVGLLDVVTGADQLATERLAIDAEGVSRDGDEALGDVGAEVAHQRLAEPEPEVPVVVPIRNHDAAGGRAPVVVPAPTIIAAGWDQLPDAEVPHRGARGARLQPAAGRRLAAGVRQRRSAQPVEQSVLRAEALARHLGRVALQL